MDTTPRYGDSDNTLLFKIALNIANRHGGTKVPRYRDSTNRLLFKIAYNLALYGL